MDFVIYQDGRGKLHRIKADGKTPFHLGPDWKQVRVEQGPDELDEVIEETGFQLGDAIAKLTKAFGIKPCSSCEKRRRILNEIRDRGMKETLKALKDTL